MASALQADGWILRSDIIWAKPNPMPESVTDRPTRAHEYVFLLAKHPRYVYDADAIREPYAESTSNHAPWIDSPTDRHRVHRTETQRRHGRRHAGVNDRWDARSRTEQPATGANKRSVWTISPRPFPGAHVATYPPDLVKPCILAGSRHGDRILDPFVGSSTTGLVALTLGRRFVGIDLNPDYIAMAEQRIAGVRCVDGKRPDEQSRKGAYISVYNLVPLCLKTL